MYLVGMYLVGMYQVGMYLVGMYQVAVNVVIKCGALPHFLSSDCSAWRGLLVVNHTNGP